MRHFSEKYVSFGTLLGFGFIERANSEFCNPCSRLRLALAEVEDAGNRHNINNGVRFRVQKHYRHVTQPSPTHLISSTHLVKEVTCRNRKDQVIWTEELGLPDVSGNPCSSAALAFFVRRYAKAKTLTEGKCVHAHIVHCGLEQSTLLGNLLVEMYGKCGAVEEAYRVFTSICSLNLFSWAIMIGAYVQNGQGKEALRLAQQMQVHGVTIDKVVLVSILSACATEQAHKEGKLVHVCIVYHGLHNDVVLGTALVNMYSKCGSLEESHKAFDETLERNVVCWNALIKAYVDHGQGEKALHLFQQMQLEGIVPDRVTFVSILPVCKRVIDCQQMHGYIVSIGLESEVTIGTALVYTCGKYGDLQNALSTFGKMPEKNVVSWNILIDACNHKGQAKLASQLFRQLQLESIVPDKVTFTSMLGACASQAALVEGKQVHASLIVSGFELHVAVGTALLNMYGHCGHLVDAWKIFVRMPERTTVSWNAMIAAFVLNGLGHRIFQLFEIMQLEGVIPDSVTFITILSGCASKAALVEGMQMHAHVVGSGLELAAGDALLSMYGKCGNLHDACRIFDNICERNTGSWNAIIGAYALHRQGNEFLRLLRQMQLEAVLPDDTTFITLFSACGSKALLNEGRQIHACILGGAVDVNVVVANAIVNMYGKCGCLMDAQSLFEKLPERRVVTWNIMIGVYAQHGQTNDALQTFQQMQVQGVVPDEMTYFNVLSACSHGGLVDEGCQCFLSMRQDHRHAPTLEHFNSMIGLLCRAGRLEEGEEMIGSIPFLATGTSWMALLGFCRMHLDGDRGVRAAELVFQLKPQSTAAYVSLANTYAAVCKSVSQQSWW